MTLTDHNIPLHKKTGQKYGLGTDNATSPEIFTSDAIEDASDIEQTSKVHAVTYQAKKKFSQKIKKYEKICKNCVEFCRKFHHHQKKGWVLQCSTMPKTSWYPVINA